MARYKRFIAEFMHWRSFIRENTYTCNKCGLRIVTANCDCGTTPFGIMCRKTDCKGMMYSSFGIVHIFDPPPTYEWYIHPHPETLTLGELEHHAKGGAFLRRIGAKDELGKDR